jgi:PAS domain S-box-containing protein
MTESSRSEAKMDDRAAIAHVSILQAQNAELQAELAQCRQELAHLTDHSIGTAIADHQPCGTKHPQVADTLNQNETWLRLAIDLNQISLWNWERATGKTEWNENNYRLLGYEPGEVEPSYQRWRDRLHPEDRARVETMPAQAIQTRSVRQIDYRVIHPDGSIHWIVDRARWHYDSAGNPIQMLGVSIDITEGKAIEEAYHDLNRELERHVQAQTQQLQASEANLRQQEREFRTLAENSPDAIFRFDLAFRYLYLNPAAERTLGLPRSQVLGKSERELNMPTEAIALWEQTLQAVVQTQTLLTLEFSTPTYSGGQWFQSHNIPECDPDGNLVSILVIERNITALKQTEAALRQSEQRFQRLAANIPGIIFQFCIDPNGDRTFPYVSPQFETLFDISAAAVEQDAEIFINCCHPGDRAALEASIVESYATLNPWQWEGRFISPSGQVIWIQAASNPERQMNGDVLWDGILMNISALKRSEVDLQRNEVERLRLQAEREQAVEALRYSEEQLRAIFDNASIAISLADVHDYHIVMSNSAHQTLLGYSNEELTQMTFVDFTYADDVPTDVDQLNQLIEGSQSRFQMEKRYIKKNGDVIWVDLTAALICDRDGNPRYSLAMFHDITAAKQHEAERQQTETALRQSEEQFRAFFENSPIAIGLATLVDHRMVRSNAKYQELLGYSNAELCQMTFIDLTHPDDITADLTLFDQLLAGSIARFHMEKRYRCKNGDFIWVDLTVALVYDTQGNPLYSLCMPQDITEAKRLDSERRQTEEALRRSQTSLAEAQRVAQVGSWEVDLATLKGSWSAELFRLFGLDPNQPKPNMAEILQLIHPSDRALYSQVIDRAFAQGEPHEVDHRIVRPDGSVAWVSSMGQVERDATGQVVRLFGVALDITDRKQSEEKLQQQADREQLLRLQQANLYQQVQTELSDRKQAEENLRRSLQEKEVLLKEVHHRVKNNLQIVSSLLRMQSRKVDNLQTFTVLQEAQNRVQSMALIHEQLYQSSDLTQIDLNEYLYSLVNNLFRSYGISHQQVALSIVTNDIYLNLNTAISCGLMINELVSNSLKYAFPNEQLGEINICLTAASNQPPNAYQITLLVSDNGIGIPLTVDWQNSHSLGLRIVRTLVHQIKGTMTRLSTVGTAFQITFAIADEP